MKMVVNGAKICIYCVDCVHVAENRSKAHDYTATIKFNANTALTRYEKQCVGEYIEYLLDERTAAEGERE